MPGTYGIPSRLKTLCVQSILKVDVRSLFFTRMRQGLDADASGEDDLDTDMAGEIMKVRACISRPSRSLGVCSTWGVR